MALYDKLKAHLNGKPTARSDGHDPRIVGTGLVRSIQQPVEDVSEAGSNPPTPGPKGLGELVEKGKASAGARSAVEEAPKRSQRPRKDKVIVGEVAPSKDLERIINIPRRPIPTIEELTALAERFRLRFGVDPPGGCECVTKFRRSCCRHALPIQAWAWSEAERGMLGAIGVGHGKTLIKLMLPMIVPGVKNALLLVPAALKAQLLKQDVPFYGQHWKLPNIAGSTWHYPDRPTLHVMSYQELSSAKNTAALLKMQIELILLDEAHFVAGDSTRTRRFQAFMKNFTGVCCASSGTLTKRELKDWWHLSAYALRDNSPVPRFYPVVEEWNQFSSPLAKQNLGPGALMRLARPGEDATMALQRRNQETFGFITSGDVNSCTASLVVRSLYPSTPKEILEAYTKIEKAWERPDGEQFIDALSMHRCLRQISTGFFYRWTWPRREDQDLIRRWLEVRKYWRQELREKLKYPRPHMDSPLLLVRAAIRWYNGYTHIVRDEQGHIVERQKIPPRTKNGPLPVWESAVWPSWHEVHNACKPATEAVWVSNYVLDFAQDWASKLGKGKAGIVWYESDALGHALAARLGAKLYGPGSDSGTALLKERGDRTIVASLKSHGTGKNLQCFSRCLVVEPPSDGAIWEQLLGRCHRNGQLADEVVFDVLQHTPIFYNGLDRARDLAEYIQDQFGSTQKLVKVARFVDTRLDKTS